MFPFFLICSTRLCLHWMLSACCWWPIVATEVILSMQEQDRERVRENKKYCTHSTLLALNNITNAAKQIGTLLSWSHDAFQFVTRQSHTCSLSLFLWAYRWIFWRFNFMMIRWIADTFLSLLSFYFKHVLLPVRFVKSPLNTVTLL